jgi:hypothetical protein
MMDHNHYTYSGIQLFYKTDHHQCTSSSTLIIVQDGPTHMHVSFCTGHIYLDRSVSKFEASVERVQITIRYKCLKFHNYNTQVGNK